MSTKKGLLTSQLADALMARNLRQVKELLRQGADPNAKPVATSTMLQYAVLLRGPRFVQCLLEAGADAREPIALLDAARYGRVVAAQLLLEAGADPNVRDADGNTALALACKAERSLPLASLLLDAGAEANPARGSLPLHNAVEMGRVDLVRLLVGRGADINRKDPAGRTPLLLAERLLDKYRRMRAEHRTSALARYEALVRFLQRRAAVRDPCRG